MMRTIFAISAVAFGALVDLHEQAELDTNEMLKPITIQAMGVGGATGVGKNYNYCLEVTPDRRERPENCCGQVQQSTTISASRRTTTRRTQTSESTAGRNHKTSSGSKSSYGSGRMDYV